MAYVFQYTSPSLSATVFGSCSQRVALMRLALDCFPVAMVRTNSVEPAPIASIKILLTCCGTWTKWAFGAFLERPASANGNSRAVLLSSADSDHFFAGC